MPHWSHGGGRIGKTASSLQHSKTRKKWWRARSGSGAPPASAPERLPAPRPQLPFSAVISALSVATTSCCCAWEYSASGVSSSVFTPGMPCARSWIRSKSALNCAQRRGLDLGAGGGIVGVEHKGRGVGGRRVKPSKLPPCCRRLTPLTKSSAMRSSWSARCTGPWTSSNASSACAGGN